jgi:hypothetical protein
VFDCDLSSLGALISVRCKDGVSLQPGKELRIRSNVNDIARFKMKSRDAKCNLDTYSVG